jgi:hypothetical protein
MSDQDEKNLRGANDSEVLLEKVRELEAVKRLEEKEEAARLEQRRNTARILGEKIHLSPPMDENEARKLMGKYSRRSFLIGGAAAAIGGLGFWWLRQPEQAQVWESIFTRNFRFNESLAQAYYSPSRLAPEFPPESIGELRVNGGEGMSEGFDPAAWRLQVVGVADQKKYPQYKDDISYGTMFVTGAAKEELDTKRAKDAAAKGQLTPPEDNGPTSEKIAGLLMTMDDIKALPRIEMITELKCIEGWSAITHWAGARFADFVAKYLPPARNGGAPDANRLQDLVRYVSLITPDGGYYVGMDMQSMLHPQTLLCYEMNFAPLTVEHGAPLRLVTPMKYGIKNIKRIGRIEFTDERPKDFWAENGYDWYSGH